ncbi:Transcription factor GTE4 [Apostasia shenzhenica]|uniref:Transcription factor GTE4 n=1 Tax=Apostasia shenzhenica TaxID=1088818 RepID=A0A2I0ACV7_9ASPA|nr:Transcription factor GTE4 [Apostasia shenzhenica]
MATGPLVDGGVGYREMQRLSESKVYTRKYHKGGPKPNPSENFQPSLESHPPAASQKFLAATTGDVDSSLQQLQTPPLLLFENQRPQQSAAASDEDVFSFNNKLNADHQIANGQNRFVSITLASKTKLEVREVRRKLNRELDQVRSLVRKLETRQLQVCTNNHHSEAPGSDAAFTTMIAPVFSAANSVAAATPSRGQLNARVPHGVTAENGSLRMRTPMDNQYYNNSDSVSEKEKLPPPEPTSKKSKVNGSNNGLKFVENKNYELAFKKCGAFLSKLMKHKNGWVFNNPVDAKLLGLHDYHSIIRYPMDLGTVKSRLSKNWYKNPAEFAEDVRLTFRNAMTYNPKGQDVHTMAEELLQMFEKQWPVIEAKIVYLPSPPSLKRPPPLDMRVLERSDSAMQPLSVNSKTNPVSQITHFGRPPTSKKPKVKDANKREMTFEEKQRLSNNLQNLPSEKLDIIVQIIKRRNFMFSQSEEEIEVDIDSVDTETLWELDRMVINYKKILSKNKRKEKLASLEKVEIVEVAQQRGALLVLNSNIGFRQDVKVDFHEAVGAASSIVAGEKKRENGSKCSSSSSSSSDSESTSSDSDSESSSGCGSDAEQLPRT